MKERDSVKSQTGSISMPPELWQAVAGRIALLGMGERQESRYFQMLVRRDNTDAAGGFFGSTSMALFNALEPVNSLLTKLQDPDVDLKAVMEEIVEAEQRIYEVRNKLHECGSPRLESSTVRPNSKPPATPGDAAAGNAGMAAVPKPSPKPVVGAPSAQVLPPSKGGRTGKGVQP